MNMKHTMLVQFRSATILF